MIKRPMVIVSETLIIYHLQNLPTEFQISNHLNKNKGNRSGEPRERLPIQYNSANLKSSGKCHKISIMPS